MQEELIARIVLSIIMIGAGALVIWIAAATAHGKVGRNAIAGLRTPSTMASDEAWLAAHRRAKRPTTWAGIVAAASGAIAATPVPLIAATGVVLVACLVMLTLVIYGAVVGSRAAVNAQSHKETD